MTKHLLSINSKEEERKKIKQDVCENMLTKGQGKSEKKKNEGTVFLK